MVSVSPANNADAESGRCFWQLMSDASTEGLYFLMLMDPGALDPVERQVKVQLEKPRQSKRFQGIRSIGSRRQAFWRAFERQTFARYNSGGFSSFFCAAQSEDKRCLGLRRTANGSFRVASPSIRM